MRLIRSILKHYWGIFVVLGCLPFVPYTSCSNVRIYPVQKATTYSSKGQLCLKPPEIRNRINKVLFVVDKSASNALGNSANDPDNVKRANNIQRFLDKHRTEEYYRWGYIAFGLTTANLSKAYISEGSNIPTFGDAQDLQQAINRQRSENDDGCTPYLGALALAKTAIENDMEKNPDDDSIYNIFFMSDGAPTDAIPPTPDGSCVAGPVDDSPTDPYLMALKSLMRVAPDRTFFSTAYYTRPENDPGRLNGNGLKTMAKYGGGKFVDLGEGNELDFDELLLGPHPESWILKRMVIYNFNGANCSDGTRDADSDADGICDKDEILYNSLFADRLSNSVKFDPLNRNSIDPNYSDLFSLKFKVMPLAEGLLSCTEVEPDQDLDLLNSCEERMLFDNQANGPTDQWTEEMRNDGAGSASKKNPDSDGDGFLDSIEFFTFGIKSTAVNYTNLTNRYSGGITGETILAEQRHPMNPEGIGPNNTDFKVTYSGFNSAGENCYQVDLNNIALFSTQAVSRRNVSQLETLVHGENENVLMIYYIMTQERNPNGKGHLMYQYETVHYPQGFSNALDFTQFLDYRIPDTY